jgi:hypothetical protein
LERRHLDKVQRDELTKQLVKLQAGEIKSEQQKGLGASLSDNSSQQGKGHAKTKVAGAKRGRPATAEGLAKKEVATKTRQSVRSVQRATSEKKPPAPKKTRASRDQARMDRYERIGELLKQIDENLRAYDGRDCEMVRKSYTPRLDGFFGHDGKLLGEPTKAPTDTPIMECPPLEPPKSESGSAPHGVAVTGDLFDTGSSGRDRDDVSAPSDLSKA